MGEKFLLTKLLPSPATFVYYRNINFHQCSKGHHILYVIINIGQKIGGQKFRQREHVVKLVKILS